MEWATVGHTKVNMWIYGIYVKNDHCLSKATDQHYFFLTDQHYNLFLTDQHYNFFFRCGKSRPNKRVIIKLFFIHY